MTDTIIELPAVGASTCARLIGVPQDDAWRTPSRFISAARAGDTAWDWPGRGTAQLSHHVANGELQVEGACGADTLIADGRFDGTRFWMDAIRIRTATERATELDVIERACLFQGNEVGFGFLLRRAGTDRETIVFHTGESWGAVLFPAPAARATLSVARTAWRFLRHGRDAGSVTPTSARVVGAFDSPQLALAGAARLVAPRVSHPPLAGL
jgi:hypothetical protein